MIKRLGSQGSLELEASFKGEMKRGTKGGIGEGLNRGGIYGWFASPINHGN